MESKETRYKRCSMHRDPGCSHAIGDRGKIALTPILSGPLIITNVHRGHGAPTRWVSSTCLVPRLCRVLQLLFAVAGIVLAAPRRAVGNAVLVNANVNSI